MTRPTDFIAAEGAAVKAAGAALGGPACTGIRCWPVRGSAVNQDGASNGFTALAGPRSSGSSAPRSPSPGWPSREVDAVEAHGTSVPTSATSIEVSTRDPGYLAGRDR